MNTITLMCCPTFTFKVRELENVSATLAYSEAAGFF